jgi:signal peptidase II
VVAVVVIGLDQLTKAWAQTSLADGVIHPLVPGLLQLRRVSNTGAAFSLLRDATLLLGAISAAVSALVVLWLLRRPPSRSWLALGIGFLLGGALGNGLDRWRLGAVIDFLEFVPISFPVFNLADVAINLAVACFVIDTLLGSRSGAEGQADPHHD